MASATESIHSTSQGFRSSSLRRPAALQLGDRRLLVDGDGSVGSIDSLSEGRSLFGRSQAYFYKIQAGIVVPSPRVDWLVQLSPASVRLSGRLFEWVEAVQTIEPAKAAAGFTRRVRLRNGGPSSIGLRLVFLSDPSSAHYGAPSRWGSIGMEAFNRDGHVAMDEVSAPKRARVVGDHPSPEMYYMTNDRARAAEVLAQGAVPEKTAGMTGQVLILSSHELELAPSESKELVFASAYSPKGMDDAISVFERLMQGADAPTGERPSLACSSKAVSEAFDWAVAAVAASPFESELLDRLDSLPGLAYVSPESVEPVIESASGLMGKDGLLRLPDDPASPRVLETSLLVSAASRHYALADDKKAAKKPYSPLKKMSSALTASAGGGAVRLDAGGPQGWRRRVLTGYPSVEVPEVSLAVASALHDVGKVSMLLGKGEEAAIAREKSELIAEGVVRRMRDRRGLLVMDVDATGKPRQGDSVDMAVACYRYPSLRSVGSAVVHRLLEEDFQTEYGPRTVPTSDRTSFHHTYGQGQLGGYWTRASLALSCLSYAVSLPGVGSLLLEKVSRLVTEDALKVGSTPGDFPYWLDTSGSEVHGDRSDPVAASRFIQAVVEGELGFEQSRGTPSFDPPVLSTINWVLAKGIRVPERAALFVGRASGKAAVFAASRREVKAGQRFESCEDPEVSPQGAKAVSFYGPGQVVCVGNSTTAPMRAHLTVAGRGASLSRVLSTPLEEYDTAAGTWNKIGSLRVSPRMTFDAPLGPCEWKAYRISND